MRITTTVEWEDEDGSLRLAKRTTESWEIAQQNFNSLENHYNVQS